MTHTLIQASGPADAAAAAALLNIALGEDYTNSDKLLALQEDGGLLIRAVDPELLGAGTVRVLDPAATALFTARLQAAGINDSRLDSVRLGEVKSLAVSPAARGRGIGTDLVAAGLGYLRGAGCRYAVAASWASGDPEHSSLGILERSGFEQIGAVPSFWRQEQEAAGYACPECGPVCACVAVIMVADLNQPVLAG